MMFHRVLCPMLLVLAGGCSLFAEPAQTASRPVEDRVTELDRVRQAAQERETRPQDVAIVPASAERLPVEAEEPEQTVRRSTAPRLVTSGLTADLLKDPRFDKWFVDSYFSKTEVEPTIAPEELQTIQTALEALSEEEYEEAEGLLEPLRGEDAPAIEFYLGNLYLQQNELDRAAEAYATAIDAFPNFLRAWKNLALIHVQRNEVEPARRAFSRVLELGDRSKETFGLLGLMHLRADDPIAAESAFRMASMLDPISKDWKYGLGQAFFQQERYADAAALFGQLLERNPDRPEFWLAQGRAYAQLERFRDAAQNFEFVIQLGGGDAKLLADLGDIYLKEKLYELAVDAHTRALAKSGDLPPDRALRAARFLQGSGIDERAEAMIAAIRDHRGQRLSDPQKIELLRLESRIAVARGADESQAEVLEKIVEIDPLDGDALILLGRHAERQDEPERAILYYEQAAGIDGFEARAKYRHAQLLVEREEFADALPLLRRVKQLRGDDENLEQYLDYVERRAKGAS